MNQELKEAIITIAEYDGWKLDNIGWRKPESGMIYHTDFIYDVVEYNTSADALLPVLRKAFKEKWGEDDMNNIWDSEFGEIGGLIVWGKLETACLKLAEIINSLNQQK